jgi:hypothetical protein
MDTKRTTRVGLAAVLIVAVTGLGLAGAGLAAKPAKPAKPDKAAKAPTGQAAAQSAAKIDVCHKAKVTIRVSSNAWGAHQRHGDVQGACTQAAIDAAKAAKAKAKADRKAAKAKAKAEKNAAKESAEDADD